VDFGEVYQTGNHPVVGVTWYEAVAYCRWLNGEVGWKRLGLQEGWEVRLPSEAEWERAARGMDGRKYPWASGEEPTGKGHANFAASNIGGSSAVGLFVGGGTPEGLMDMGGNVWEWTRSLWGRDYGVPGFKYPYDPHDGREEEAAGCEVLRVLRGGSWDVPVGSLRCAFRFRFDPTLRDRDVGFRVVASP
jgi:formylglycine-generating enzyme required for sulfatase activity